MIQRRTPLRRQQKPIVRSLWKTGRRKPKPKAERERIAAVRCEVFERAEHVCEICRRRRAESMDEVKARSLGGVVSVENSIAVCGSGTTGCHGFRQRHEFIVVDRKPDPKGNGRVWMAKTKAAREWLETTPP